MANTNKMERIDSEIMLKLSDIIIFELKDPRITSLVTVTQVETAKDLKTAKVYISVYDKEKAKDVIEALNQASGYIRHQLFDRLKIRMVPYFTFTLDKTLEHSFEINKILHDLQKERQDTNE
ncbi:MAG: 30S ribosome-binding factor RbfA [Clostridia bacterium]